MIKQESIFREASDEYGPTTHAVTYTHPITPNALLQFQMLRWHGSLEI